jgi:hypothetical protein
MMKTIAGLLMVVLAVASASAQTATPPATPADDTTGGDACAKGIPTTFRLQENRDRLLRTLAEEKQVDACTLWKGLSVGERNIFEMVTAFLGSCDSRLAAPPSTNTDTLLDHTLKLYSINAPGLPDLDASPVPSGGGACGGYNANRAFVGFDETAIQALRASNKHAGGTSNPDKKTGYNKWRASDDPGGAHTPFTARDMISWGGGLLIMNSDGPTCHFFASDSDINSADVQQKLWDRRGVCGVADPHMGELTVAFNWDHESDPLCGKDWRMQFVKKIGVANFNRYNYVDGNNAVCGAPGLHSRQTGPDINAPYGGLTHAGLGRDKMDNTCPNTPTSIPSQVSSDLGDRLLQQMGVETASLQGR